jgi:hypothetical protein
VQVADRVFTANEAPPSQRIAHHHEIAQCPVHPLKLFFYCDAAADQGGETPIALSHEVYTVINQRRPGLMATMRERGIKYVRVMTPRSDPALQHGRGWEDTYLTKDRGEVERLMGQLGQQGEWLPGGALRTESDVIFPVQVGEG